MPGKNLKAPSAICDRCGIRVEVTKLKKEWTGFMVCQDCFGFKPEKKASFSTQNAVPNARPGQNFTPGTTTLSSSAAAGAESVVLTSVDGVYRGSPLGIELDNSNLGYFWTIATADPTGTTVTILEPLYGAASAGNTVIVPGAMSAASVADMTEAQRRAALYS